MLGIDLWRGEDWFRFNGVYRWSSKGCVMNFLLLESKDLKGRSEEVPSICVIFQEDFYAPNYEAVEWWAAALRTWFYVIEAQHIVLVTHVGFLHYLTEDGTVSGPKKCTFLNISYPSDTQSLRLYKFFICQWSRPYEVDSSGAQVVTTIWSLKSLTEKIIHGTSYIHS